MTRQRFHAVQEVTRVLKLEAAAIIRCEKRLRRSLTIPRAMSLLEKTLDSGGKIIVTGIGKSGKVAQKIASTLSSTGSTALYLHPTEGLHGDLGIVQSEDCILALSYSGNTEEMIRLLPALKARKVPIIGIGGNLKSKLAVQSAVWIDASVDREACPHNLAPTTSTTLCLAIGDALAVALMKKRGFTESSFAKNHPAGSIGKKLSLQVQDLMFSGKDVGTVEPTASMDRVVSIATQKKLGGVLVVQGKKLLGIITDGDIRRALKKKEAFFGLHAQDIMTPHPITIDPSRKVVEALRLMEARSSQINVLPVVTQGKKWKGLIRLHDIVRIL